jgi:hypothetical protein
MANSKLFEYQKNMINSLNSLYFDFETRVFHHITTCASIIQLAGDIGWDLTDTNDALVFGDWLEDHNYLKEAEYIRKHPNGFNKWFFWDSISDSTLPPYSDAEPHGIIYPFENLRSNTKPTPKKVTDSKTMSKYLIAKNISRPTNISKKVNDARRYG